MIKTIYRISDAGYSFKVKPEYATKENCLRNFLRNFGSDNLTVIADNCSNETLGMVASIIPDGVELITTSLGNAGSFKYAFEYALKNFSGSVYFVEDDYLHLPESKRVLQEGLELSDFVTLYDHNDKYSSALMSPSYILLSSSSHWRTCPSTTMTFAANIETLRNSQQIIRNHCSGAHPNDNQLFLELGKNGYTLISALPGYSTHCETDWLSPLRDWKKCVE